MRADLTILNHAFTTNYHRTRYLARLLAEQWQSSGLSVNVVQGPDRSVQADALLMHINTTQVPQPYFEFAAGFASVINGRCNDTAKTAFSQQLVHPDDDYSGPVIIKTNANYGGLPDFQAHHQLSRVGLALYRRYQNYLPWSRRSMLNSRYYPVLESIHAVPAGVWNNPNLVVEKFLTERDEQGNSRLRIWYFFGEREFIEVDSSTRQTVKGPGTFSRVQDDHVPDDLRQLRQQLGFDYGKFDFAIVDGNTVLYDINRTPTIGPTTLEQFHDELVVNLAKGLDSFLATA